MKLQNPENKPIYVSGNRVEPGETLIAVHASGLDVEGVTVQKQLGFKYQTPLNPYEIEFEDYKATELGQAAAKFDDENPHVYVLFAGYARTALSSGREQFGIAAVWERMRWEMAFSTNDKKFKISNNHKAYYSRKIMAAHKDFHGFFVIKAARQ